MYYSCVQSNCVQSSATQIRRLSGAPPPPPPPPAISAGGGGRYWPGEVGRGRESVRNLKLRQLQDDDEILNIIVAATTQGLLH